MEDKLSIVGKLPASLPKFKLIDFNIQFMTQVSTKALAVAIVGLIQTLAVVKSLETRTEEKVDVNKEFIGQGVINMAASCYRGFASAGSFTNSFLNYQLGAKSRISELIAAIFIGIFIVLFNPIVRYIPIASLAGLVILVATQMISKREIIEVFRATKADTLIFVVTFGATILLPRLEQAVYLGVIISLIVVLKESSTANVSPVGYDEEVDSKLAQKEVGEAKEDEYVVIDLAGSLNFSAAEDFKEKLDEVFTDQKAFVIRVRNIDRIDLTSVKELDRFINRVQEKGGDILLSGVEEDNYEILKDFGIIAKIGEDNVFFSESGLLSSTVDAVKSAENEEEAEAREQEDSTGDELESETIEARLEDKSEEKQDREKGKSDE
jgi:SulP family sulfate permease